MKIKKRVFVRLVSLLLISMLFLSVGSCKKEKCGCEGEERFRLEDQAGTLYYQDTAISSPMVCIPILPSVIPMWCGT